ncbi:MAG: sodium-dependent transporter [Cytophagales bacterium]|nr:sodium-dependent transporter [Cytophagales bacterium]
MADSLSNKKRGGFTGRMGFILAAAGSAIGLGNVWKFPFEVADGGGAAFLFMYLIFCFVFCLPIMVSEISIGRAAQRDAVSAFETGKKSWNVVGKLGVLSAVLVLSFYNIVAGWALGYVVEILMGNFSIGEEFGTYINDIAKISLYAGIFMLLTAYTVSKGISKGIERLSKVLMPLLLSLMVILILYGFFLPHAGAGLKYYLIPNFANISLEVIYNAMGQAFFSLSLGLGAMITYGSYLPKNENIVHASAFVVLADVGIAFLAGLMIFPFVAHLNAGDMSDISGGAGLIFVTLPGGFESLGPGIGLVVGSLFFLLLSFAALTSTVSLLEIPVAYAVDKLSISRKAVVWFLGLFVFLLGIPSLLSQGDSAFLSACLSYLNSSESRSFMDIIEHISSDTFLPLGGFGIVLYVLFGWRKKRFHAELSQGYPNYVGSIWQRYLDFSLAYLCPVILSLMVLLTILDRFIGINVLKILTDAL